MEQLNSNGNRRGMSEESRKNLRPNRAGRLPSKLSLVSLTKQELQRIPTMEEDGFDGKGQSNAWWLVRNAVRNARLGDRSARQEVWERVEGKVTQPVSGEGGEPIRATITVVSQEAKKLTEDILAGKGTD